MAQAVRKDRSNFGSDETPERRDIAFALHYWDQIRGKNNFPAKADVDPDQLRDLWPFVFLVDLGDSPESSVVTYGGDAIADFCGCNPSGQSAADCFPPAVWDRMMYLFGAALKQRQPLGTSDSFTLGDGRDIIYRSVIMPLSDDQGEVTSLLGVIKSKAIQEI